MKPRAKKTTTKKYVLVRTYSAGVHVGIETKRTDATITLSDVRRVWRWRGANSLNELALKGGDDGYTRISEPVPTNTLTEWIEIIPCSKEAVANLTRSRWPA